VRAGVDVLIVGGGSAGCVLAARLTEDPRRRVCLVEAGGPPGDPRLADPLQWPYLEGGPFDWAYRTTPQPGTAGRVHGWPRGRVLGGSSQLNAMTHVRGHPSDFDAWAEVAGPEWSHRALLPDFLRSESFSGGASEHHGAAGPMTVWLPDRLHPVAEAFMRAAEEAGFPPSGDHNGPRMEGPAPNSLTIRHGRRVSAADAYLDPARGRPNLSVVTDALVERVVLEKGRATGVEARVGGERRTLHAETVVLAAGTVSSPLILMRSGIGPPDELSRHGLACRVEAPAVGEHLHDHLLAAGNVYRARRPVPPSRLQHSESLLYVGGEGGRAPDIVAACVLLPAVSECFERPEVGTCFTLMFGVCHPRSRGRITLGGPAVDDPPVIDPAYLTAPEDRERFRAALRLARRVGGGAALDEWRDAEILPGPAVQDDESVDRFVARASVTHHHPVGTCAMGRDPCTSVVDGGLGVHGVGGLLVADASVIPAITTGPVHAAVLAISERAARLI
jgi:pyridoxine 4-oxidase